MKAYKDPTADQAISEADKWERKQRDLEEQHKIHRGDTITIRIAKREGVDGRWWSGMCKQPSKHCILMWWS